MRVAGFGFRRTASLAVLAALLDDIEAHHGRVDRLAVCEAMAPLVLALGEARGRRVVTVAESVLPTVATLTRSRYSLRVRGTGSVAEAVALLGAGPGARLLAPRTISADRKATIAVARGNTT